MPTQHCIFAQLHNRNIEHGIGGECHHLHRKWMGLDSNSLFSIMTLYKGVFLT
jgi:hypothetical protein